MQYMELKGLADDYYVLQNYVALQIVNEWQRGHATPSTTFQCGHCLLRRFRIPTLRSYSPGPRWAWRKIGTDPVAAAVSGGDNGVHKAELGN
jgi:hypothetical protein